VSPADVFCLHPLVVVLVAVRPHMIVLVTFVEQLLVVEMSAQGSFEVASWHAARKNRSNEDVASCVVTQSVE